MWQSDGWLPDADADYAAAHYGAYATTTPFGLKIISINTDFWYVDNIFNYYDMNDPDRFRNPHFPRRRAPKTRRHFPTGLDNRARPPRLRRD